MQEWLDTIGALPQGWGSLILLGAALVEYVFPPFPGDAVCLFGAFLVGHADWNLPVVFGAVMVGNVAGFSADYAAGRWMRRRVDRGGPEAKRSPRLRKLEEIAPRFRRHVAVTLATNRFLPGIRAFLFVGAGYFGVPFGRVVFWGTLSALGWNALIFAAGITLGMNWGELQALVSGYTTAVWVVLGVLAAAAAARWWIRRRRPPPAPPTDAGGRPDDQRSSAPTS